MYMNSSYERFFYHPNMDQFIDQWIKEENERIDYYNANLPTTNLIFDH
jgi:hypothetical protein